MKHPRDWRIGNWPAVYDGSGNWWRFGENYIAPVLVVVILGLTTLGLKSCAQINRECAEKCHPYSFRIGTGTCWCDTRWEKAK